MAVTEPKTVTEPKIVGTSLRRACVLLGSCYERIMGPASLRRLIGEA